MKILNTKNFIRDHIHNWFLKRTENQGEKITLNGKIIYILPTRYGVLFGLILLTMLAGSINYDNSMGYLLTFLLSGLTVTGMLHTYKNLFALTIEPLSSEPVFCGEKATFKLKVTSENPDGYYSINYGLTRLDDNLADILTPNEIFSIAIPSESRGHLHLKPVRIWTEFPVGMFHAWSWVKFNLTVIVYPKPFGQSFQIEDNVGGIGEKRSKADGYDDYSEIRKYQNGDPPKHIAWKAVAKGHDLLTKQYTGLSDDEVWFEWDNLDPKLDIESRLSQLCLWVIEAESKRLNYGLRLPNKTINPAHGYKHKTECLTYLALY